MVPVPQCAVGSEPIVCMLAGIPVLVCVAACQNCMSLAWRCSATRKQRWEARYSSQSTFTYCGGPAAGAVSQGL